MSTMYLTDPSEANPYAQSASVARAPTPSAASPAKETFSPFGKDGLTFADLIDIVNPLQHIPIVSTIYRRLTGDELGMAPRLMGGALFGGFAGFVASLANAVIEQLTGKDVGEHVASLVLGEPVPAAPAVAKNEVGANAVEGLPWLAAPRSALETAVEGLPWLEAAGRDGLVLVGPPRPLTPRAHAAAVSTPAEPVAALGGSIADPLVATRLDAKDRLRPRDRAAAPLGATANAGGWFSDIMLTALDRYQATAKLAQPGEPRRVDLAN